MSEKLPQCDCSPIVPFSHSKTCPIYADIVEQINYLASLDHKIVGKETVERISFPFGVNVQLDEIQDRRSEFKGAYFPHLKEGEWATDVIDASILAEQLCRLQNIPYRSMEGRGFRLQECVRALREFWGVK